MKKRIFLVVLFLLVLLAYFAWQPMLPTPFAWNDLPTITPEKKQLENTDSLWVAPIANAQNLLIDWQKKLNAPSLSMAIGHQNEVLWSEAVGYADLENKITANEQTIYRIGSISKSITSVALATLFEKKMLQPDDQMSSLLTDDYNLSNSAISIKQLASHTAGIRHYGLCFCLPIMAEGFNSKTYTDVKDAVAIFGKDGLLFTPGEGFRYSTYGYTLLSAAIQEISQQPFLKYLQTAVLNPLGMQSTKAGGTGTPIDKKASFYEVEEGQFKPIYPTNISNKWAGGGLLSTPTDLVRMGNALQDSSFLSPATKAQLFTPIPLKDGTMNPQRYGMGWRIGTDTRNFAPKEVKVIHHGGTIGGGIALIIMFPEYDLTVSMMTNRSGSSGELFEPIFEIAKSFMEVIEESKK